MYHVYQYSAAGPSLVDCTYTVDEAAAVCKRSEAASVDGYGAYFTGPNHAYGDRDGLSPRDEELPSWERNGNVMTGREW